MRLLNHRNESAVSAGLLALRTIIGIVFVAHGSQKLFVYGIDGVTAGFSQMGIPAPAVAATFVAFGELLGGVALLSGLFTRFAAAGLAVIMLGAMAFAHLPNGFFAPDGVEFTLSLFGAAIVLALTGPGQWSADALIAGRRAPALVETERATTRKAA